MRCSVVLLLQPIKLTTTSELVSRPRYVDGPVCGLAAGDSWSTCYLNASTPISRCLHLKKGPSTPNPSKARSQSTSPKRPLRRVLGDPLLFPKSFHRSFNMLKHFSSKAHLLLMMYPPHSEAEALNPGPFPTPARVRCEVLDPKP